MRSMRKAAMVMITPARKLMKIMAFWPAFDPTANKGVRTNV
jgi:hypothetical protein